MKHPRTTCILAITATLLLIPSVHGQPAEDPTGGDESADRQACIRQLEKIHEAIQAYRRDHKDLPDWLSELVPNYLADENQLVCPITRKTGRTHTFEHLKDPKMLRAYLYEFSPLPMGNVWAGGDIRMRDFKRRQMGLVGGEVPIARCHLHDRVLNLAFSGKIYDSGMNWEQNFTDYVDFAAWRVEQLFPDARRATAARQPAPEVEQPGPEKLLGEPAPEFSLPLLEGGTFELAAHRRKRILLLDFWATWCGPCRVVMPALVEVARAYADRGVQYYAVNLREEPEVIRRYLKDAGLEIAVPLDKDGSVARKYGVKGIPTMVIMGRDGRVKKVHVGSSPTLKAELSRALDELLPRDNGGSAPK
jgi:thiol-disulfide isomerase/thioredoxin